MNTTGAVASPKPCYWCGHPTQRNVQFCQHCKRPLRWKAYLFAIIKGVFVPLLLSFTLLWTAKSIDQAYRETKARSEERVALANAYIKLAENISKFRDASVRITSACRGSEERCYEELHRNILDIDGAINRIGPRLAPFTEYADRNSKKTQITKVWEFCFVAPYFRGEFDVAPLFQQLHRIFESHLCGSERCNSDARRAAQSIVHRVWSGCVSKKPQDGQPMDWLLREATTLFHGENPLKAADWKRLLEGSAPMHTIWTLFNANKFEQTIDTASKYASSRKDDARSQARQLINGNEKSRPVGAVSPLLRDVILADAELNNVATCYLLMGWAALQLNRIEDARRAFQRVRCFPEARTWDPQGWFWSPAEAAKKELEKLR